MERGGVVKPVRVEQRTLITDTFSANFQADGRVAEQIDHRSPTEMTSDATQRVQIYGPPDPLRSGFGAGNQSLRDAFASGGGVRVTVAEVAEGDAGGVVYRVSRVRGDGRAPRAVYTIDPAQGFLITRAQIYTPTGELGIERTVKGGQVGKDEVWVPIQSVERTFKAWHAMAGGEPGRSADAPHSQSVLTLRDLTVNEPVAPAMFTIDALGLTEQTVLHHTKIDGTLETLTPRASTRVPTDK